MDGGANGALVRRIIPLDFAIERGMCRMEDLAADEFAALLVLHEERRRFETDQQKQSEQISANGIQRPHSRRHG